MAAERQSPAAATPEAELVYACSRPRIDAGRTERVRAAAARVRNWPWVVRAAGAHAVLPALHRQLAAAACAPDEVLRETESLARGIAFRNIALAQALVDVLRRLDAARMSAMVVKGPALAITAYGDLAFRQFGDLDIIVPRARVAAAIDALSDDGWLRGAPLAAGQEAALLDADYHSVLVSERAQCALEIHWALERPHAGASFDAEWCRERAMRFHLGGRTAETLTPEASLIYLCAHGAKHLWCQLRWVCDVAEVIASATIPWDSVMSTARAAHMERILSLGLRLAHDLCDAAVPAPVLATLRVDDTVRELEAEARARIAVATGLPTTAETATIVRYQWRARDRARDRLRLAADLLFSPQLTDVEVVPLPTAMRAAYYVLRPARLAGKYARRLSAKRDPRESPS